MLDLHYFNRNRNRRAYEAADPCDFPYLVRPLLNIFTSTWIRASGRNAPKLMDVSICGLSIRDDTTTTNGMVMGLEHKSERHRLMYPKAQEYLDGAIETKIHHTLKRGMTVDDIGVIAEALTRNLK